LRRIGGGTCGAAVSTASSVGRLAANSALRVSGVAVTAASPAAKSVEAAVNAKTNASRAVSARLRALLRRGRGGAAPDPGVVDRVVLDTAEPALVLDMSAGTVRRGDDSIHLTVTEYRLLCELASPTGRVRSRQSLLDAVWDKGFFGDERIVDVHIRRLRTKVERDPGEPQLVVTVRGLGYRLDPR
jgi:DNA-binding response OmpR family regulator